MSPPLLVLLVHAAATWAMTGLIWFVQIVHYPLFARVGAMEFAGYEADHTRLTGTVVAPLMLLELGTALWLALVGRPAGVPGWMAWSGLGMVAGLWLVTFFVSVPQHAVLTRGFDINAHTLLVATNWARTILWSARGVLVMAMLAAAIAPGDAQ
jgi:hypothetical protein